VYAVAPGRVNLIGEHTDYCQGYVFPMAINLVTIICGKKNGTESTINLVSENIDSVDGKTTTFDSVKVEKLNNSSPQKWSNYVRGVVEYFHQKSSVKGFDAVIISTVPIGGGLSSSASLEVSFYTFLENLFVNYAKPVQKALDCQKAEHEYADMPCGIMDQFISTCGKLGHATLIDCSNQELKHISMPDPDIAVLIINSNKKHELSGSEYPERRDACFAAAKACGVASLREASLQQVQDAVSDPTMLKRATHVVKEIQRTKDASRYLAFGDYENFGKLMNESHDSLRDLFEVSTPELDELVELARQCDGVYGSRMTGGGFGGCTVTLVDYQQHEKVIEFIDKNYKGGKATFFLAEASEGARALVL